MKKNFIEIAFLGMAVAGALLVVVTLCGCKSTSNEIAALNARREYVSWMAFCASRGYNANHHTFDVTNEYLDTWCGSVDEEEAFIKAGVEPY